MIDEEIVREFIAGHASEPGATMARGALSAFSRLTAELTRKDAALNAVADALEQINIVTSHDAELVSQIFATIRAALGEHEKPENEKAPDRP